MFALRCALMLRASAPGEHPHLRCAHRPVVRMSSMSAPCGHGHPDCSRRRLASASLTTMSGPRAIPPPRVTGDTPVTAVASSDDSQQHWRGRALGPDMVVRDGRIGYWYTNSRFARGAMVARATGHLRDLQIFSRARHEWRLRAIDVRPEGGERLGLAWRV